MPQKFEGPPYNFATIPLGTAFLAFGLGGILGKWSGGLVGDKTCSYLERKYGHRQPEHRLWALVNLSSLLLGGYMLTTTVLRSLSFHLCLSVWSSSVSSLPKSSTGLDSSLEVVFSSSVFLLLLAYCKLCVITLSLSICSLNQPDFFFLQYVLEGYMSRSMDTQAVFIFFKSIWGFAIPFFVYNWGEDHGFFEEYITQGALAAGVGAILCAVFILKGYEIRKWQGMPISPL